MERKRKKMGPKGLGLSVTAMKARRKELDKLWKNQTRTVTMTLETHKRWLSLAKARGLTARELVVSLLDEVDENEGRFSTGATACRKKRTKAKKTKLESQDESECSNEHGFQDQTLALEDWTRNDTKGIQTQDGHDKETDMQPSELTNNQSCRLILNEESFNNYKQDNQSIEEQPSKGKVYQTCSELNVKEGSFDSHCDDAKKRGIHQAKGKKDQTCTLILNESLGSHCDDDQKMDTRTSERKRDQSCTITLKEESSSGEDDEEECENDDGEEDENDDADYPKEMEIQPSARDYQSYTFIMKEEPFDSYDGNTKEIEEQQSEGGCAQQDYTSIVKEEPLEEGWKEDATYLGATSQSSFTLKEGKDSIIQSRSSHAGNISEMSDDMSHDCEYCPAVAGLSLDSASYHSKHDGLNQDQYRNMNHNQGYRKSESTSEQDMSPPSSQEYEPLETVLEENNLSEETLSSNNGHTTQIRTLTGKYLYVCNVCNTFFSQKEDLLIHTYMKMHKGEKQSCQCSVCDKVFISKCELEEHMKVHTQEKSYMCTLCSERFLEKAKLTEHMKIHIGEKHHQCTICGKSFLQKSNLKRHMYTHTGEKPHSCLICKRAFADKSTLKCHMRTHTGEKPYICNLCKKAFRGSKRLKIHMRTHTGEKPYICNLCEKAFAESSNLKKHIRLHTGEKPYK